MRRIFAPVASNFPREHTSSHGSESAFVHIGSAKRQRRNPFMAACLAAFLGTMLAPAQQLDSASVIQRVDAAVKARIDNVAGYTDTEHYAVYRSKDEVHPVAEMTVITTYRKESGKSYTIVSQTGSAIVQKLVLGSILDNEKHLNEPGIREKAWITTANYVMTLRPGGIQMLDGRPCLALTLVPKRKASFLIDGTLWVDAADGSIVQVQGTTSGSSSLVSGPTQITRQYADVNGFPEAIRLRGVSESFMFGRTIVKVEYRDYRIQLRPDR
jgi:outer membrane lipoprotein-sorting protein